jgi:hypothetical protein
MCVGTDVLHCGIFQVPRTLRSACFIDLAPITAIILGCVQAIGPQLPCLHRTSSWISRGVCLLFGYRRLLIRLTASVLTAWTESPLVRLRDHHMRMP